MDLPDYRYDPEAYELEEKSRPDEMMMIGEAAAEATRLLDAFPNAYGLDLCCGTGLSTECLVEHPNVVAVAAVDNCKQYLTFAQRKFKSEGDRIKFILSDAVDVSDVDLGRRDWDVIMLSSAYHHIEDSRKVAFLSRVRGLLGKDGRAVMAENVLPIYLEGDEASYHGAVETFYQEVLRTARNQNPNLSRHVETLIERVAQYGYDGDYEYKVCMPILSQHLTDANLEVSWKKRVWPKGLELEEDSGNFVFTLKSIAAEDKLS